MEIISIILVVVGLILFETISSIDRVKRYIYLKNGAMYSIFVLGTIMVLDSFGVHIPEWLSPVVTIGVIGYFFYKSRQCL